MPVRPEFALIEHFRRLGGGTGVVLGIGDDAALLEPSPGTQLVASTDTLIGGVHFPAATAAEDVGYKALAVNLSDMAAMGAEPRWALLALTLPSADESWLTAFVDGWRQLAVEFAVALVGGDLTEGPLSVTVQLLGEVPAGAALTRAGAAVGDAIAVTGSLGDAALALRSIEAGQRPPAATLERLNRPRPRLAAGRALRGLASACIDVSDGLAADLGHLLEASGVGARVAVARLPLSAAASAAGAVGTELALTGGDDYELCFSFLPRHRAALGDALAAAATRWTEIGEITRGPQVDWVGPGGARMELKATGYGHFEPRR